MYQPTQMLMPLFSHAAAPVLQVINSITGVDTGQIETAQQRNYLKNVILNRIRETGNVTDNELGYSDYDSNNNWSGPPTSITTESGMFSPNFAYQNTLGATGFSVPETGGSVDFKDSGTLYDFGTMNGGIWDVINQGGLAKNPLQHYTPNINITPEDIFDIFGGGAMMRVNNEDRPEISSYQPSNF